MVQSETDQDLLTHYLHILKENMDSMRDRFHVKEIAIFGSFAKHRATSQSDVDILVDFIKPITFFKFIELEEFLTMILGRKVDLVARDAVKEETTESIFSEAIYA